MTGDNFQEPCFSECPLRIWTKAVLKSLTVPGGVLLAAAALLTHSGWVTLALPALHFLNYCALIGGMLLAWRFHSSRSFQALLVLFLAQEAIDLFGGGRFSLSSPGWIAATAAAVLVSLNFVLIALTRERGFSASALAPSAIVLFVQFTIVAVLCRAAEGLSFTAPHGQHLPVAPLPEYALIVFVCAAVFLLVRFLFSRKPLDSALLWSLSAFVLSLRFITVVRLSTTYAATAACVIAISVIENSYLLAYHDELTTLPSRRAFNDALLRLQAPYSIAVVDIDHFKKFNDTYGHDTGDQVLCLVAANLTRVTGGGQAYRCGGEEFNIVFPGKTAGDVIGHLERLRNAVASSEFHLRGSDRRQVPRGADRRSRARGRIRKADAIRELARESGATSLSVTVSIGVATSSDAEVDPEHVLKAADKALYRAKKNGRNRLEAASASLKKARPKAAGIA